MLRKIKDQNKWRDSVYGSEDPILLRYQLFQTDLQIQCNLIKILASFCCFFSFREIDKVLLNFTWKCKIPRRVKTTLKKNKARGLTGEGNGSPLQYSCLPGKSFPWAEEPGELQSMGSLRVGNDWETSLSLFTLMH